MGISHPLKTRNKSKYVVVCKIVIVWVTTCLISSPLAILAVTDQDNIRREYHCEIFNNWFKIFGSTVTFLIPMGIMIVAYLKTTKLLMQQVQLLGNNPNQQSGLRRAQPGSKKSKSRSAATTSCSNNPKKHEHRKIPKAQNRVSEPLISQDQITPDEKLHALSMMDRVVRDSISCRNSVDSCGESSCARRSTEQDRIGALLNMHVMNTSEGPEFSESEGSLPDENRILDHLRKKFKAQTLSLFNLTKRQSTSQELANEQKATRVLGVVFSTFFVCWTPFFTLNFILSFCSLMGYECIIPPQITSTFLWLGYISSTINPVIYTIFNKRFRETFARLIRCRCQSQTQSSYHTSHVSNGSVPTAGNLIAKRLSAKQTRPASEKLLEGYEEST